MLPWPSVLVMCISSATLGSAFTSMWISARLARGHRRPTLWRRIVHRKAGKTT